MWHRVSVVVTGLGHNFRRTFVVVDALNPRRLRFPLGRLDWYILVFPVPLVWLANVAEVAPPRDGHEGVEQRPVGRRHVGVQDHVVDRPHLRMFQEKDLIRKKRIRKQTTWYKVRGVNHRHLLDDGVYRWNAMQTAVAGGEGRVCCPIEPTLHDYRFNQQVARRFWSALCIQETLAFHFISCVPFLCGMGASRLSSKAPSRGNQVCRGRLASGNAKGLKGLKDRTRNGQRERCHQKQEETQTSPRVRPRLGCCQRFHAV